MRASIERPGDLAANLGLAHPTVSKHLSTFRVQGLVERQTNLKDGRRICLRPTPKGHQTARALIEMWREGVRQDLRFTAEEHIAF